MFQLINLKIKAAFSITSIIVAWIFAQVPMIEDGFDKLFSIGLLMVAVVVIWKAFSRKDESETELLKEQIEIQQKQIEYLQDHIETLKDK